VYDDSISFVCCGRLMVPKSTVYFGESIEEMTTISFFSFLIRTKEKNFLINTGFPNNTSEIERFWIRNDRRQKFLKVGTVFDLLSRFKLTPSDIDYVFLTPIVQYATGMVYKFQKAKVVLSSNGFLESMFHCVKSNSPDNLPGSFYFDSINRNFFREWPSNVCPIGDCKFEKLSINVEHSGQHHTSSLLISLDIKGKTISFTDSIFTARNLEERLPIGARYTNEYPKDLFDKLESSDIVIPMMDSGLETKYPTGIIHL